MKIRLALLFNVPHDRSICIYGCCFPLRKRECVCAKAALEARSSFELALHVLAAFTFFFCLLLFAFIFFFATVFLQGALSYPLLFSDQRKH